MCDALLSACSEKVPASSAVRPRGVVLVTVDLLDGGVAPVGCGGEAKWILTPFVVYNVYSSILCG